MTVNDPETEAEQPSQLSGPHQGLAIAFEKACRAMDKLEPPYTGAAVDQAVKAWRKAQTEWAAVGRELGAAAMVGGEEAGS